MSGFSNSVMSNSLAPVQAYQVPAELDYVVVNLDLLNMDTVDVHVKIAISQSTTPLQKNYIRHNEIIAKTGGTFSVSCIIVVKGERILIEANSNNVSIRVSGLEKV